MAFVADDLAAWLTGLLADVGRKKLTALVLGTDQERALRSAAAAAIRLTVEELRPGDQKRAEQLAMVISQVFSDPPPALPLTAYETLLEALQARIAGQLSVLDDAGLTETGQSSADVLGIPAGTLAQKLTGHLLQEIVSSGARGGPLSPLASQLNDDVTHLQGNRIEDVLSQLAGEVRAALARLGTLHGVAAAAVLTESGMPTGVVDPPVGRVDPTSAGSPLEFVDKLREVRTRAGRPSLEEMARLSQRVLARSTLSDLLNGDRLPSKEQLLAFLTVCGVPEPDRGPWVET